MRVVYCVLSIVAIQIDPPRLFDAIENDLGARGAHAGEVLDLLAQDAAKMRRIGSTQLDQVTVRPGDLMDFLHAGNLGKAFAKLPIASRIGLDKEEGGQPLGKGHRIEANLIPFYDSAFFQLADPLKHCGWCHADLAGDLGIGNACLLLKDVQYLQVYFVDYS